MAKGFKFTQIKVEIREMISDCRSSLLYIDAKLRLVSHFELQDVPIAGF